MGGFIKVAYKHDPANILVKKYHRGFRLYAEQRRGHNYTTGAEVTGIIHMREAVPGGAAVVGTFNTPEEAIQYARDNISRLVFTDPLRSSRNKDYDSMVLRIEVYNDASLHIDTYTGDDEQTIERWTAALEGRDEEPVSALETFVDRLPEAA